MGQKLGWFRHSGLVFLAGVDFSGFRIWCLIVDSACLGLKFGGFVRFVVFGW